MAAGNVAIVMIISIIGELRQSIRLRLASIWSRNLDEIIEFHFYRREIALIQGASAMRIASGYSTISKYILAEELLRTYTVVTKIR